MIRITCGSAVVNSVGAANQIWSLEPSTIAVTGVSLNQTAVTLTVGGSAKLTAAFVPENATNKAVTWSSSDASVASVDSSGNVQALKPDAPCTRAHVVTFLYRDLA